MNKRALVVKCGNICSGTEWGYNIKENVIDGNPQTIVTFSYFKHDCLQEQIVYNVHDNTIKLDSSRPSLKFYTRVLTTFGIKSETMKFCLDDEFTNTVKNLGRTTVYTFVGSIFINIYDNETKRHAGIFIEGIPYCENLDAISLFIDYLKSKFVRAILFNRSELHILKYNELIWGGGVI